MYCFPDFCWAATIARSSAMLVAIGTVEAQCLPGSQHRRGLPGVVRDAGYQMDRIDILRGDDFLEVGEPLADAEPVAGGLQPLFILVADRHPFHIRVIEIDRHKFSPEPQPDHCHF